MSHYHYRLPSKYRCFRAFYPFVIALFTMMSLEQMGGIVCSLPPFTKGLAQCQLALPETMWLGLLGFFCYSGFQCAYRFYRDFYCGKIRKSRKEI
jgi:hypothetical protein